ncbi:hypothetical protein AOL_s00188g259 [Orbilia oligospora ATCC 24927]|uniref:C2H2-type domain-containing protein n=1 Tax=Arthrobotrys oligospora (strain ATCC 24927 / CBS 115.81 / DSM 1491) TaxID=756982 RepID=G1XQP7_ARTOA|nr:hypothetical protein AOL_s00188g259 [Orbilia oligospora ATCC 24927]EGX44591.1 hypothetical protein AOL_s00188g259 [Orbilia oligospora ATCC 24927]
MSTKWREGLLSDAKTSDSAPPRALLNPRANSQGGPNAITDMADHKIINFSDPRSSANYLNPLGGFPHGVTVQELYGAYSSSTAALHSSSICSPEVSIKSASASPQAFSNSSESPQTRKTVSPLPVASYPQLESGTNLGAATFESNDLIPPQPNPLVYASCQHPEKHPGLEDELTKGYRRSYLCTECPTEFTSRRTHDDHVWSEHGRKNYSCPICPRMFARYDNLKPHITSRHGAGRRRRRHASHFGAKGKGLTAQIPVSNVPPFQFLVPHSTPLCQDSQEVVETLGRTGPPFVTSNEAPSTPSSSNFPTLCVPRGGTSSFYAESNTGTDHAELWEKLGQMEIRQGRLEAEYLTLRGEMLNSQLHGE